MNISIKSYQTSIPAKAPAQEGLRSENTTKSTTENTNSSTAATVSISSSAQGRYIQSSAIERQTSMSQSELKSLYAKGQKDIYNFGHLIAGGSYNKDDLLPKTDDPARLTLGQKSLDWAIGLSQSPPKHLSNPFAGMARNDLSAIVYDDSGTYTEAERYAAYGELSKQDEAYFSSLSAKLTNGGDNRDFFQKSLLQKSRFARDFLQREAKVEGAGGHFWHDEALTQTPQRPRNGCYPTPSDPATLECGPA